MTGLEFDSIDILGPTDGRAGMGYFDCFCIPSVSSEPPTPENPNPASSRHCEYLSSWAWRAFTWRHTDGLDRLRWPVDQGGI